MLSRYKLMIREEKRSPNCSPKTIIYHAAVWGSFYPSCCPRFDRDTPKHDCFCGALHSSTSKNRHNRGVALRVVGFRGCFQALVFSFLREGTLRGVRQCPCHDICSVASNVRIRTGDMIHADTLVGATAPNPGAPPVESGCAMQASLFKICLL